MKATHFLLACASLLATSTTFAQRVEEGEVPAQRTQLIKVNLTDFALGQYTAAFEQVLNDNSTLVINLGGIGFTQDQRGVYLGSYYDEFGNWFNLEGSMQAEVSGFELTPEYRRFGYIHDGMPEGLYVSAFAQLRRIQAVVDETLPVAAADEVFGLTYPHEVDHTMTSMTVGAGFNLGYQWMADNGLSIDVYFGPMFRAVNQTYDFATEPVTSAEEAIDAVEGRFRNNYWSSLGLTDAYTARTGPWIRGGITVGLGL